ncbi:MAG TPA: hypothetical protein VH062_11375 [Polyangiaceae bacterium]|nr:hypothetical protein [Polyangiaceae bacterium]
MVRVEDDHVVQDFQDLQRHDARPVLTIGGKFVSAREVRREVGTVHFYDCLCVTSAEGVGCVERELAFVTDGEAAEGLLERRRGVPVAEEDDERRLGRRLLDELALGVEERVAHRHDGSGTGLVPRGGSRTRTTTHLKVRSSGGK